MGLPERPADRIDKTMQPGREPMSEVEREFECEKYRICKTKILFSVLCLKCSRNYRLGDFLLERYYVVADQKL